MSYNCKTPHWLNSHPDHFIFKMDLSSFTDLNQKINSKESKAVNAFKEDIGCYDKFLSSAVWYRPIDAGFEIDHIEVPKALRGQGWGQKLLEGFIEFCREQKKGQSFEVWLEVSSKNAVAQKLYLKLGFKQVHLRPSYYEDLSDALVMTLKA